MNSRVISMAVLMTVLAGCGGTPSCKEPQRYQAAHEGTPVQVPNDLDELPTHKELKIPEPSPRPPRPANAECLEIPPQFKSS